MNGGYARGRETESEKKVNSEGAQWEAVIAESVAENSEEEAGEGGGETIWLSVCLGSQFAKLKLQKSRRRTKVGLPGKNLSHLQQ